MKNLRVIQDRGLDEIVIIDNSILSFALQIANGVPISSYTGEAEDKEM